MSSFKRRAQKLTNTLRIYVLFSASTLTTMLIQAQEKITVYTEEFPPYNFKLDDKIVGINTEIVIAVLDRCGFDYDIKLVPWKRAYMSTLNNKNTLLYSVATTPERQPLFKWVGPIEQHLLYFYKLKTAKNVQINSMEDIKKYKIGVIDESLDEHILRKMGLNDIHLHETTGIEHFFRIIKHHRVDLTLQDPNQLRHVLLNNSDLSIEDFEPAFALPYKSTLSIAVNKDTDDAIVKKLRASFDEVIATGLRGRLMKKYLLAD